MTWKIPLNKPFFNGAELQAVKEVLDSGMVSQGKMVEEFEEVVRKYVGAKYAVAVSSCTAGLYLALKASNKYKSGTWKRALIPAFTFPAAQNAVKELGKFEYENVDVDKNTHNADCEFQININRGPLFVGFVIAIDQFGLPCNMNTIERILDTHYGKTSEHRPVVIRDSACALGSEYDGEKIGHQGTAVFSFHGRKIITTGEGGMVVTDNEKVYEAVLEGRQFGKNKDGKFSGSGMNFKMSDIAAAIGMAQMEKLNEIIEKRSNVAVRYGDQFDMTPELDDIALPCKEDGRGAKTNWQSYVVRNVQNRDSVMSKMRAAGIECQVGSYDNSGGDCPVSAELARTTLALPIWPGMTEEDAEFVVEELRKCL